MGFLRVLLFSAPWRCVYEQNACIEPNYLVRKTNKTIFARFW